jgi:hypothetical protein
LYGYESKHSLKNLVAFDWSSLNAMTLEKWFSTVKNCFFSQADFGSGLSGLTFFLHASLKTLPKPAVPTLVPLILVHNAVSVKSTSVHVVFSYRSSEEPFATIAG